MEGENRLPSRIVIFSVAVLIVMMFACGSVFDRELSELLVDMQSGPALFFTSFGEYPAAMGLAAAGTMLIMGKNRGLLGIIQVITGAWLILSGAVMAVILPMAYMGLHPAAATAVGSAVTVLTVLSLRSALSGKDKRFLIRMAVLFILVILLDIVIVNIIKNVQARPRMRLIMTDESVCFLNWWESGRALRDSLMKAGVSAEEFRSFPSGHSANASLIMLFSLLPASGRKRNLFFMAGVIWTLAVALSRIIMGAHFLSDTATGFAIGLAVFVTLTSILFPAKGKVQNTFIH
ncbi:MAG: phosphatase PAP2 family protein [Spirochaetales bacterium]|nr:phosphatase PAP2 family protein [Spirochaetales bacterium]